jgi:hypothetical protein
VRGDLVTLDGDEYMKVRHVSLLPDIGDMQLYASNLFTGSEELSKYTCRPTARGQASSPLISQREVP